MDNLICRQWQQWENRVEEWFNSPEDDLDFTNTLPFDRVILTILTVKYQVLYRDMDKQVALGKTKTHGKREATVKLFKTKGCDYEEQNERHRDKEKLFDSFTGRFLSPQQVCTETSAEWQEFNQLHEWHGLAFLQRFEQCIRRFVGELISTTPEYQELLQEPTITPCVNRTENVVYEKKNEGQVFLSADIKSANFALLQHIRAIDPERYPTWADFLSFFVGSRPLLMQSKRLRMACLGELPEYYKLEALWTDFTAKIYQTILYPFFDQMDTDARCVSLTGDEVVFHLNASAREEKVRDLIENVEKCLLKASPIVKFRAQVYRLRAFQWQNKHMCFARLFIGQADGQFDLKCVPNKQRNYDRAYADFRLLSGLQGV